MGCAFTHAAVSTLEFLKIAPEGTIRVSQMLNETADDLVEGGRKDVFTPMYFFLAHS
jgi:sterol 24-C-methyltransferase